MNREEALARIAENQNGWDIIIIGGGASGMGVALDAVSRGYSVLLLEQSDFAKGTSSRSTKLVHGGVRYLAQGDISLVFEALEERGLLLKNAPHLVKNQSFIIPVYSWTDSIKYTAGLKLYDIMAGRLSFGKSHFISREETLLRLATVLPENLKGGVVYQDGQFDDSRLVISLAGTCIKHGAEMLNYAKVTSLLKNENGKINGINFLDLESGQEYSIKSKAVVNATGVFSDSILQMDQPNAKKSIVPSQGVHIVLERHFLPGSDALMIPETSDGRVLFAVPWHNKLVVGTTDTPVEKPLLEPVALEKEIDFILATAGEFLTKAPLRSDVLSVFAGQRPLAVPSVEGAKTKEISRNHKIIISSSKLITITGGKWTTFRKMGEDTVSKTIDVAGLPPRKSTSNRIQVKGYTTESTPLPHLDVYGSDYETILKVIEEDITLREQLHPDYPYLKAEVIYSVREEMARTIEDFLARRIRILLLDAKAACEMAPIVAKLIAKELGKDEKWQQEQIEQFKQTAKNYFIQNIH
jgi:glycerol-3-phosphate dehydrogenase